MESGVEELMPRLLPVGDCDLTEDFDPTVPPRTPQEYLKRVQIEAANCPDVVVAQIDPKKLKKKQTVNISLSGCQPAPVGYSPTLKWQQQQVAHFSTIRQNVNKHRDHWKAQQLDSNVAIIGFPPLLSIVSRMNQATVTSVLEYLTNWLGKKEFTPELGRWLYALLACLEKPLLPEAHSLIRQLARQCSEVRALEENKNDEKVSALNLIICLVGRYFDQHDLADEAT
nr:gem-associated protein 2 isoform X3 [Anolis sagrei ordinatus]